MTAVLELTSGQPTNFAANRTRYNGLLNGLIGQSATESEKQFTARTAGAITNLLVYVSANTITATSTIRTRKNGANGNNVLTIASSTTGEFEDTAHSDTVSAGDKFNYQSVTGATGTSMGVRLMKVEFAASSDTVKFLGTGNGAGFSTASTSRFFPLAGQNGSFSSVEDNVEWLVRTGGTLKNMCIRVSANARSTDTVYGSRKNGANGNLTVTVAASSTGFFEDTSNSDTLASGDTANLHITTGTGTGSITTQLVKAEFLTTTSSWPMVSGGISSAALGPSTTNYLAVEGDSGNNSTTEANNQIKTRLAFTARYMAMYLSFNGITAQSDITVRKNGGDTGITASVASSTTGVFEDLTHSAAYVSTDTIVYKFVIGGSGSALNVRSLSLTAGLSGNRR